MISALVSGTLTSKPSERTSKNGNQYATCQLKAAVGSDESFLVSLVAFDSDIIKALVALNKGDSLCVTGSGKPSTWSGRDGAPCLGLSVKVDQLMTPYSLTKKRAAGQSDKPKYGLPAVSPLLDQTEEAGAPF